jgi:protein-disulfide isomerase
VTVSVVIVLAVVMVYVASRTTSTFVTVREARPIVVDARSASVDGRADAPVVLIQFMDLTCPHCARLAAKMDEIRREYVSRGVVQLQFRNLPLVAIHSEALAAAETATCLGEQGRLWAFQRAMFLSGGAPVNRVEMALASVDHDRFRLEDCLATARPRTNIAADIEVARALGVSRAPTTIVARRSVDGFVTVKWAVVGNVPARIMREAIEAELNRRP